MKKSRLITVCFIIAVFSIQTILPALPQDALRKMKTATDSPKAEETALSDPFPEDRTNLYISSNTVLQEVEIPFWERMLFKWPGVLKEQIHPLYVGRFTIKYINQTIEVSIDYELIKTIVIPFETRSFYYKGSLITKIISAWPSNRIRKFKILPLTAPKEAKKIVARIEKMSRKTSLTENTIDSFKDTVIRKHPLVLAETLEQLLIKIQGTEEIPKKQKYAYFYFIVLNQLYHNPTKPSIPLGRFSRKIIRAFESIDTDQLKKPPLPAWSTNNLIVKMKPMTFSSDAAGYRAVRYAGIDIYGRKDTKNTSFGVWYDWEKEYIWAGLLMHKEVREELMNNAEKWLKQSYKYLSDEAKVYIIAGLLFNVKPEHVREALQEVPDSAEIQAITTHLQKLLNSKTLHSRPSELSLWGIFLRLNNLNDVRIEKLPEEIFSSI